MKYRSILLSIVLVLPFAAHAEYAWDLLKSPSFKSPYLKVIGTKRNEYWISQLPGPSNKVINQTVQGQEYLLANSCKPHWCNTNNLVLAYSSVTKRVFVKLVEDGKVTWLGAPTAEMQSTLDVYYEQHFGKK